MEGEQLECALPAEKKGAGDVVTDKKSDTVVAYNFALNMFSKKNYSQEKAKLPSTLLEVSTLYNYDRWRRAGKVNYKCLSSKCQNLLPG